ncbi:MAG: hypothetical protein N2689_03670 [Verrucomicrobiae bacterium]|nr:hypothetical protein [Verrucomicrobiae bacterium]
MTTTTDCSQRQPLHRRDFIRAAAAAATASAAPFVARGRVLGANDRIGVGFIGCGHRSAAHAKSLEWLREQQKEAIEFVAFMDTYRPRLEQRRAALNKDAKVYRDYRELIADPAVDLEGPTASPMDIAYHTQTALIMGMLAYRAQKTAKFDAQKQEIVI